MQLSIMLLVQLLIGCRQQSQQQSCVQPGLTPSFFDDDVLRGSRESIRVFLLEMGQNEADSKSDLHYFCQAYDIEIPESFSLNHVWPMTRLNDAEFAGCMCFQLKDGTSVWGDLHPLYGKKALEAKARAAKPWWKFW